MLDHFTLASDTTNMADVELSPEATDRLEELPKKIHARVLGLLQRLREWPEVSGAKALSGELAGSFRMRTGDYRLRFRVQGGKVFVDKIGHRKDFYED